MNNKTLVFTKPKGEKDEVIRSFLKRNGFSTSLIAKVKYGGVKINGEPVTMRALLKSGDTVTVTMPCESSEDIPPIDIKLDIIYEDDHLIAVNKPRNMPVHPSKGNSLPTLANAIMAYYGGDFVFRAVNRLDRDTSGIVIIAKNMYSSAILSRAIKERRAEKKYVALVEGTPCPEYGIINAPIERECEGSMKRIVREDGKESITEYKVIKSLPDRCSVCELTPITGRTHQIRVHMAHIGHPLLNDFLYGTRTDPTDTYRLHCKSIIIPHPEDGRALKLECNPDFL